MRFHFREYLLASLVLLFLSGLCAQAVLAQDPGDPGPFAVTRSEYTFGDTAFTPMDFPGPVEVTASVHYPTGLPGGPFPLIIFLHGRHATCFQDSTAFLEWPCSAGRLSIPSYEGYDYVSGVLASWGYIVVSISANGINAQDDMVFDFGAQARAELIQRHLNQWSKYNTTGDVPFDEIFIGKVNLDNVGTMGHSRGGEGVVRHFLYNASLGSPYNITAVLPLAPVDFNRPVLNGAALAVPLPYCDGDVSDLQGVHFYDDSRYNSPGDPAAKHTILVMGANHNFFNTIWTPGGWPAGTADDWIAFVPGGMEDPHCGIGPGNRRLTPDQQKGVLLAYLNAFFRTYVGGETAFIPLLTGDAPPPPSAMTNDLFVSYHPPDNPTQRLDVNTTMNDASLTTDVLGGDVTARGLTPYDVCGGDDPEEPVCIPFEPNGRQPHTTPSARSPKRGLSQLRTGWTDTTASWQNDLPLGSDVSTFANVQFRAGVNFGDIFRNPAGTPKDFSVTLTDGAGKSSTTVVSTWSGALFFPPGQVSPVPKLFLNTIRIPLTAFTGINLADIRSVKFEFGQQTLGALMITDLAFTQ